MFIFFKMTKRMDKDKFGENIYAFLIFIYLAKVKSDKAEYLGRMLKIS